MTPIMASGHKRLTVYGEVDEDDDDAEEPVLSKSNVVLTKSDPEPTISSKISNFVINSISPSKRQSEENSVSVSVKSSSVISNSPVPGGKGRSGSPERGAGSFVAFLTPNRTPARNPSTSGSFSLGSMVSSKFGSSLAKAVLSLTASNNNEEVMDTDSRLNAALKKIANPSNEYTDKQRLEQQYVRLHEKALQIVNDMLDAIEVSFIIALVNFQIDVILLFLDMYLGLFCGQGSGGCTHYYCRILNQWWFVILVYIWRFHMYYCAEMYTLGCNCFLLCVLNLEYLVGELVDVTIQLLKYLICFDCCSAHQRHTF